MWAFGAVTLLSFAARGSFAQDTLWQMTDAFTIPADDWDNTSPPACTEVFAGCTGSLNTKSHAVAGDVEVVNDCTLRITGWQFDATGPAVEWWATPASGPETTWPYDQSVSKKVGELGLPEAAAYQAGTQHGGVSDVIVRFGTTGGVQHLLTDEFNHLSVWCEEFAVDFGNVLLDCEAAGPGAAGPEGAEGEGEGAEGPEGAEGEGEGAEGEGAGADVEGEEGEGTSKAPLGMLASSLLSGIISVAVLSVLL